MNSGEQKMCCGGNRQEAPAALQIVSQRRTIGRYGLMAGVGILGWWLVYGELPRFAEWVTYGLLNLDAGRGPCGRGRVLRL